MLRGVRGLRTGGGALKNEKNKRKRGEIIRKSERIWGIGGGIGFGKRCSRARKGVLTLAAKKEPKIGSSQERKSASGKKDGAKPSLSFAESILN